jgi:hypothetical protein
MAANEICWVFRAIEKRKVLTFGTMGKKKTTKSAGREITFKAEKKLFAELSRKHTKDPVRRDAELLFRAITIVTFYASRHAYKNQQSNTAYHIEGSVKNPFLEKIHRSSVWVFDGMAILQQLKLCDVASFGDLAQLIFAKIVASQYRSQ